MKSNSRVDNRKMGREEKVGFAKERDKQRKILEKNQLDQEVISKR